MIDEKINDAVSRIIDLEKESVGNSYLSDTKVYRTKIAIIIEKVIKSGEKAPAMRISPKGLKQVYELLVDEMNHGRRTFGEYTSAHHLYAVLLEEMDEFWETVKSNKPDYGELLQIAAVALRGYIEGMYLNRDAKVENIAYD